MPVTIQDFIQDNRQEILEHINAVCPNCLDLDNDDLELWVRNDQELYEMALEYWVDMNN